MSDDNLYDLIGDCLRHRDYVMEFDDGVKVCGLHYDGDSSKILCPHLERHVKYQDGKGLSHYTCRRDDYFNFVRVLRDRQDKRRGRR